MLHDFVLRTGDYTTHYYHGGAKLPEPIQILRCQQTTNGPSSSYCFLSVFYIEDRNLVRTIVNAVEAPTARLAFSGLGLLLKKTLYE